MIFEMAGSYEMLVPLVLAAAIGYGLARPFQPGSAYTLALRGRGIYLTAGTFQRDAEKPSPPA
jgi:H+/Cl- antiporter ClcA